MKNDNKEKKSFKELWKNPVSGSLIKLGLWGVFFVFVYIFIFATSNINKNNYDYNSNTTTTKVTTSYKDMKDNLLNKEQEIVYSINDYYIKGTIKNNILKATLEDNDSIYNIKYDGINIYNVKKGEDIINEELLADINKNYLIPNNIIALIDDAKVIGTKSRDEKVYSYNIESAAISVYLGDERLEKIIVLDSGITYNLEFKEVGLSEE